MWKVPEISMGNEVKKRRMPVIKLRSSRDLLENKSLSMKLKKVTLTRQDLLRQSLGESSV
jgi:hypothetical protein